MTIMDALLGEHGALYAMFDHIEKDTSADRIQAQAALLNAVLLSHAVIENDVFFPALAEKIGRQGPLAVMEMEHAHIEEALEGVATIEKPEEARALVLQTIALAREHFAKEEQILFMIAEQHLDPAATRDLAQTWAERRNVASPLVAAR